MEALKKDVEEHPDNFIYERAELIALQFSGHIFNGSKKGVP